MYFDGHSDIWNDVTKRRLSGETDVFSRYHAKRLKEGMVEGSIFVIWVDPPYTEDYGKRTRQIMEAVKAEIAESKELVIVHNYSEMMKARENGQFYVFIGVEGMAYIGSDVSMIDDYYDFGARHAMLTWNEVNDLGAGAASGKKSLPLTEAGRRAVHYMNDKGMLIDVSHLNEGGFWDVARLSTKPFVASHSNASALCDVSRNLTDDQLRAIRDANGCVGLNSFNWFISRDSAKHNVEELARHAAHMIDVMGIDHVGCGFDFCEFLGPGATFSNPDKERSFTHGLEDCRSICKLFECFDRMGMTSIEKEKIARLNFQRVIKEVIG